MRHPVVVDAAGWLGASPLLFAYFLVAIQLSGNVGASTALG